MKVWLRKLLYKIDKGYPLIGDLIFRIRQYKTRNRVRNMIHGKNNMVSFRKAKLTSVIFDIVGDANIIEILDGSILNNVTFYIRGNNHRISIERECCFYRGGIIWFEDNNCSLLIGEKSTFEDVHLAVTEPGSQIRIGQDCMFANDIDVRTGDSHSIISQESNERINYAKNVYIGNHVWIAAHSILLKGTFISDNSIVATGSVVTKRYMTKGIIIGGNPSIKIKEGISWARERIYKVS